MNDHLEITLLALLYHPTIREHCKDAGLAGDFRKMLTLLVEKATHPDFALFKCASCDKSIAVHFDLIPEMIENVECPDCADDSKPNEEDRCE